MPANNKKPLLSICIPVYNGETFIKGTMQSLFAQDYQDYELIICDDGSTDKTVEILQNLLKEKDHVKFVQNEKNLGLVENWNKCVELSSGEYIKFVFQDDNLLPGALSKTVAVIENHKPSFLTSKRKFILPATYNEAAEYHFNTYLQKFELDLGIKSDRFIQLKETAALAAKFIGINFIGEPSVFVFKKDLFKKAGKFNSSFQQLCDLEFALRCVSVSDLYYMHFISCEFRIHEKSTTVINVHTKHFHSNYFEYIKLATLLLYDKSFENLRSTFTLIQRSRIKLFLKNKIYSALNDEKVTNENRLELERFLLAYSIKGNKNSLLLYLVSTLLKIKNAR